MTATVAALVAVSGIYAILSAISPRSEETRRAVYLVLSLSLLAFLLTPLASERHEVDLDGILDSILGEYNPNENGFTEEARRAVNDGIRRAVCEEFSLPDDALSVECTFGDGLTLTAVRLCLSGVGILADLRGIEAYGKENFCENCEVILRVQ